MVWSWFALTCRSLSVAAAAESGLAEGWDGVSGTASGTAQVPIVVWVAGWPEVGVARRALSRSRR